MDCHVGKLFSLIVIHGGWRQVNEAPHPFGVVWKAALTIYFGSFFVEPFQNTCPLS
jgi:hypothetical protein